MQSPAAISQVRPRCQEIPRPAVHPTETPDERKRREAAEEKRKREEEEAARRLDP